MQPAYPAYPPQQPPTPAPKSGMPVWLIVLLVVIVGGVFLVGTLTVVAIYGVRKYIAAAKQTEARNSLGQIAKDAAVAFEEVPPGGSGVHGLCASASASVPPRVDLVRGSKYQSTPSEWDADAKAGIGFACLKFSLDLPQYYMYSYRASGRIAPGDSFRATANGDLDGDGMLSTFAVGGHVPAGPVLEIDPAIDEKNPEE
jgi:type IV pilus assembly protein PilA